MPMSKTDPVLGTVRFTEDEIHTAGAMRLYDRFTPTAGHFVFDANGNVTKPSPFQPGVYFVLNYDYFMNLVGGVDSFRKSMVWLPTIEQCFEILNHLDCPIGEATTSRIELYRRIASTS